MPGSIGGLLMKWLGDLLKKRKRDDRIKIIMVFAVLGIVMVLNTVYRIVKLYGIAAGTEEYLLTEDEAIKIKDIKIDELAKTENVVSVSRQKEMPLELKVENDSVSLNCIELSESYLKTVYKVNVNSSMRIFYINKPAYDMLMQSDGFAEKLEKGENCILADYALGEEGTSSGSAKVMFVEDGLPDDMPYAFCKMQSTDSGQGPSGVRVMFANGDLTLSNKGRLTQMGFVIADSYKTDIKNLLYEKELLHIKYSALAAGLCFMFILSVVLKFMALTDG